MESLLRFLDDNQAIHLRWDQSTISLLHEPRSALLAPQNQHITDELVDRLDHLATESFGGQLDPRSKDGVRDHVINVGALALLHTNGKVHAFASAKTLVEEQVFYLHGVAVSQHIKGRGAGTALTYALLKASGLTHIAFTTQNPIMYRLMTRLCHTVHPSPSISRVPVELHQLGRRLVTNRPGEFDPTTFVIRNLYEKCLYNRIPECGNKLTDDWFKTALHMVEGCTRDAFLLMGKTMT